VARWVADSKVQHNTSTLPARRHPDTHLVTAITEIIAYCSVGCSVIEAGRHGHLAGVRQQLAEPTRRSILPLGVQPEVPEPIQGLPVTSTAVFGVAAWRLLKAFWGVGIALIQSRSVKIAPVVAGSFQSLLPGVVMNGVIGC
jgi:hypothetical protein